MNQGLGPKESYEFPITLLNAICGASSRELAAKLHELIGFKIRRIIASSTSYEDTVEPPSMILILHIPKPTFLQGALTLWFATRSLDPESNRTEKLWIQAPPKFLRIKIAREILTNDRQEKDCHSFQFPLNFDRTLSTYAASQTFHY